MIYQGLFNILSLYSREIFLFYNKIDKYFRDKIYDNFKKIAIDPEKNNLDKIIKDILNFLSGELEDLGFRKLLIDNKFSDESIRIHGNEKEKITSTIMLYEEKISPIIYELFLEIVVDYLVDDDVVPILMKFKKRDILPIEFMTELRNLKNLFEDDPKKQDNLRKYVKIREKIIQKFRENKKEIEGLEYIDEPRYKLQLVYLIYRIIDFFHLQKLFDFTHIKKYLSHNIDEWLYSIPLVSLKNPEPYFCGIYLADKLNVELDTKRIQYFLLNLYDETVDEFEAPITEATDRLYYYVKSLSIVKLWFKEEKLRKLFYADEEFFDQQNLKSFETSQLVVIIKMYKILGFEKRPEIKTLIREIERRISSDGIKQFRDGFISSEATYYTLFCNYMRNSLERLKNFDLLSNIVSRIYRNLEILDFSKDMNYDLISEIFYSCESLKLINCIETEEMIKHLAKYLFPDVVIREVLQTEKDFTEQKKSTKFRHLKINKITGETIY
ncbi:MAG: hypothetical protein R6U96_09505 [Promethearchaeia archaeon]